MVDGRRREILLAFFTTGCLMDLQFKPDPTKASKDASNR